MPSDHWPRYLAHLDVSEERIILLNNWTVIKLWHAYNTSTTIPWTINTRSTRSIRSWILRQNQEEHAGIQTHLRCMHECIYSFLLIPRKRMIDRKTILTYPEWIRRLSTTQKQLVCLRHPSAESHDQSSVWSPDEGLLYESCLDTD